MISLQEVNEKYRDVLAEIGNIGAGNATTAVADMLGLRIDMSVPQVQFLPVEEIGTSIGAEDEVIVGIMLGVGSDIDGSMMFLMDMESAHHIVNRLMMRPDDYMEDFDEMRKELLEQLKLLVDFDSADFYLASVEDEKKLDRPVMYNCDSNLSEEYEELDYSRGIMLSGKSLIYRETDIISDESRVEMEYYKKVYKPNNWHYSLQVVIAKDHHFLGTITFYRTIGKENFKYDDIFVLDMLKDHLAYRMEKHQRRAGEEGEKLTVTQAVEQYGLTRREDTILRNLMQGKENPVICEELTISTNTLKKHILNIYRKLGIRNRVQLFKMIREHDEAG